jgi:hypothetical protein
MPYNVNQVIYNRIHWSNRVNNHHKAR